MKHVVETCKMHGFKMWISTFLFLASTTTILPSCAHVRNLSEVSIAGYDEGYLNLHAAAFATLSFAKVSPFNKRSSNLLGDGWFIEIVEAEIILPVQGR